MSFALAILQVLLALIAVVFVYFKWSFQYWKRRGVPYLEPSIPFGNLHNPLTQSLSPGDEFHQYYTATKHKGLRYAGVYNITFPGMIIRDLELTKRILLKDFSYFADRGSYVNEEADPLSAHLFSLGGTKWKDLRRKLTPTFTTAKMRQMFKTVLDCSLVLEKYLQDKVEEKKPIEIKTVIEIFSTDVIGNCAFGIDCNCFEQPNSQFRVNLLKALRPTLFRMFVFLFANNVQSLAKLLGIRFIEKSVSDFFFKLVSDTIKYRQVNGVKRNDFMQLLMEMMNTEDGKVENEDKGDISLTINDIAAQSLLFFLAGFETSSTTTMFSLFELAQHPELQDKLRNEIIEVLEKHDNQITYDSIAEMTYMGQVIDETLRKYPALPVLNRLCLQDWKIPDSDDVIEKGTNMLISVMGIHHDSDYYEDPEKFDPDRFTEENKQNRHQFAHIPFGEGPRICIGLRFGIMQTKVGLTTVLKNYRVSLNEKTRLPIKYITNSINLAVDGGIFFNLEKINK